MADLQRRLRYLEVYAVVSMIVFGVLTFTAFTKEKEKITELDVERLNVREKNGQLVLTIANSSRMPDAIVNGKSWKEERPPGMIFFNGLGDENGSFTWGGLQQGDYYGAYEGITFDKYKQAMTMALVYNDKKGKYRSGLQIWDRPETPLNEIMNRRDEIAKMVDGEAKTAASKKLKEDNFGPTRLYIGKNAERESEVTLYDTNGKARIKMLVGVDGNPKLDFLDAEGKVIQSLPNAKK